MIDIVIFIWTNCSHRSVSKYTNAEGALVKSIVGSLTIKRVPESEIIKEVYKQTNKTISRSGIYNVKQQIKRDSFKWYQTEEQEEWDFINFSSFNGIVDNLYLVNEANRETIIVNTTYIFEWVIGECVRCTCTKYRSDQQKYCREKLSSFYFVTTNLIKYPI